MRRPWWLLIVLACVLAAGASDGDDLVRNRRLLARWRTDPEHYQRLQNDLKAFYGLPRARQERLRKLDRELHEGDLTTQTRLWSVLDRYASWLERLPEADRARVVEAPDRASRLKAIREIRDREWVERLPARLRDEVQALPAERRAPSVAELRQEEQRQRNLWQKGTRSKDGPNLRPSKTSELAPEAVAFVKQMTRRLNAEEKERLKQAEGKWPDLPRAVRELADFHPALPPLPSGEIRKYADLPRATKEQLEKVFLKRKVKVILKDHAGRWPDYALEVAKLLQRERLSGPPLGASKPPELPAATRAFLETRLFPSLNAFQKENLSRLEERWPEYPMALVRMARERQLLIPGLNLPPGPPEVWENSRLALWDEPDRPVIQFAREGPGAGPAGIRKQAKDSYRDGAQ
jgi:hypothetical protein